MKKLVIGQDDYVGPWICARAGGTWVPGRGVTIGLAEGTQLLAGMLYEDCNGANIIMHCAAEGSEWMTREFLWFSFAYPFEQLGVRRVTSPVAATNFKARHFVERLGATLEATLKDAHPTGDLLVYCMRKEDCRWLNIKRSPNHGQERRTGST